VVAREQCPWDKLGRTGCSAGVARAEAQGGISRADGTDWTCGLAGWLKSSPAPGSDMGFDAAQA